MSRVMDRQTADHFYRWLERTVAEDEQHEVEQGIHALLRDQPGLLVDHSWPELRVMAEAREKAVEAASDQKWWVIENAPEGTGS